MDSEDGRLRVAGIGCTLREGSRSPARGTWKVENLGIAV
jgi:hypothetical protein